MLGELVPMSKMRSIIAKLEDPVTDLVRRDSLWTKLGLTEKDAKTEDQVVKLLLKFNLVFVAIFVLLNVMLYKIGRAHV